MSEGPGHGDRLTALDAAFLRMEGPTRPMHAAGLFVFDAPASGDFDHARFLALVRSRLHRVPRYRQRLAYPPFALGNPVWVDDREFDLSYHVRHAALPRPGTTVQLTEYAARILSRRLDRSRPLWELYVIEGLEQGQVALLVKSHRAMIDGRSGIDIATAVFDFSDEPDDQLPAPEQWAPQTRPSSRRLAFDAVRELAASPAAAADGVRRVAAAPTATARRALDASRGVASVAGSRLAHPAPRSLLNRPPSAHRRFALQRIPLADAKRIKDALSTTVNDVVLATVADATGRYLRHRGARTDGLWLRAMVPVSTRDEAGDQGLGNRIVPVLVDLPMGEMDPVERLRLCAEAMAEVRSAHHAVGASFLAGLSEFAPPTLHAVASRVAVNSRLFNFLITNVPGPQAPIYCLGARLIGAFPFAPLAANHAFGVGLTSMDGSLNFGFTADHDAMPDVEHVCSFLVASFEELTRCAEAIESRARHLPGVDARGNVDAVDV